MSDISGERIFWIERLRVYSPAVAGHRLQRPHGSARHGRARPGGARAHRERGGRARLVAPGAVRRRIPGGAPPRELFRLAGRIAGEGSAIDLPLWELAVRLRGVPLYRLLGARGSRAVELYDGSIYIDDPDAGDAQAPHPARGGWPRHQDQRWTPTTG